MKTTGISLLERGSPVPKTTNRAELIVAFVGAGGAFTKPGGRGETNLVLVHRNTRLALDCGRLWPEALPASTGLALADIDAFLITHCHADHANGLATAAQECRWVQKRKPTLVLPHALEPYLWGETLKGGLAHDTAPESTIEDYFDVARPTPIDDRTSKVTVGDLDLEIFRTCHAPGAAESWRDAMVSYGVFVPKFNVFISMDTRFDRELIESYLARGAEWLFHDLSRDSSVHATQKEYATMPVPVQGSTVFIHTPDDFRSEEAPNFANQLGIPGVADRGDAFRFTFAGSLV